jgi:hypothetical protein
MQLKKELSKTQEQLAAIKDLSSPHQKYYYTTSVTSPSASRSAVGRREASIRSHQDDLFLKSIAEKDYHMSNLLGE